MSDNPLFPLVVGIGAAAAYWAYKQVTCECHGRRVKRERYGPVMGDKTLGYTANPVIDPKDFLMSTQAGMGRAILIKVDVGERGSRKYIYHLPDTGNTVNLYTPLRHNSAR